MKDTHSKSISPEFRDRAVRMVQDHRGDYASEWAALTSIAEKIGGRVPARGVGAERGAREAHGERSAPRAGLVIVDLR